MGVSAKEYSVVIFGGRGGGAVVAHSVLNLKASGEPIQNVSFLNDQEPSGTRIEGHEVAGGFSDWQSQPETSRFIAPLHKAEQMADRARRISELGISKGRWCNVIDPQAQLPRGTNLGTGVAIGPYAVLQPGTSIGDHVAVRSGAVVGHNSELADFVFVGVNSVVCGYSRLGTGAYIAPNATTKEGIRVGRFAVVGLGAVVLDDVPDYAVVAGNPARVLRELDRDGPKDAGTPDPARGVAQA